MSEHVKVLDIYRMISSTINRLLSNKLMSYIQENIVFVLFDCRQLGVLQY